MRLTWYKLKNVIKEADPVITEDEADYLAEIITDKFELYFTEYEVYFLIILAFAIGALIGTLN